MSALGDDISPWLVVFAVLAAGGTAGTTVVYQDSAQDIQTENDALRAENGELREQLNETREDQRDAETRAEELNERLVTRNEDVESLVSELEKKEERLNATRTQAVESQRRQTELERSELIKRLNFLCAQEENEDRFGCRRFGNDE